MKKVKILYSFSSHLVSMGLKKVIFVQYIQI